MLRVLVNYLLPLLLPFLVYAAYVGLTQGRQPDWLRQTPWLQLGGAGLVLLAISLFTWSLISGAPTDRTYVPPRFEDGRVVPGVAAPHDP